MEQFEFFWGKASPFSNFYPCTFTLAGKTFKNSEQAFMYQKAMMFGDTEIADEILKTSDPKQVKQLGRAVMHFDNHIWERKRVSIMYDIVAEKFHQNPNLMKLLVATEGKSLVEASPYDKIWGIGLEATDSRALNRDTWQGENLLGEILTEIRDNHIFHLKVAQTL